MARRVFVFLALLVRVACEGPIGPIGPEGPQGEPGPAAPGAALTWQELTGVADTLGLWADTVLGLDASRTLMNCYTRGATNSGRWIQITLTAGFTPSGDFACSMKSIEEGLLLEVWTGDSWEVRIVLAYN